MGAWQDIVCVSMPFCCCSHQCFCCRQHQGLSTARTVLTPPAAVLGPDRDGGVEPDTLSNPPAVFGLEEGDIFEHNLLVVLLIAMDKR
jgi:hypothetical protein